MARKLNKNLLALGSAAIVSIYAVGFARSSATPAGAVPTAGTAAAAGVANVTQPVPVDAATAIARALASAPAVPAGTSAAAQSVTSTPAATAGTATASIPTPAATSTPPVASTPFTTSAYRDGTYSGTGTSRLGDISVAVTVQSGQVTAVRITGSTTHYPTSRIAPLPGEVVAAQSTSIKLVSGATYSSQAFKLAVTQALAQAAAGA